MKSISKESELLYAEKEYFAAGFFEDKNASYMKKFASAISAYLAHATPLGRCDKPLFPNGEVNIWGCGKQAVQHHYAFSILVDFDSLARYAVKASRENHPYWQGIIDTLTTVSANPLSYKYSVGGRGFTHAVINFERIVKEGLASYQTRIRRMLEEANKDEADFYEALDIVFEAVTDYHRKIVRHLESKLPSVSNKNQSIISRLLNALCNVPMKPAKTFYEGLVTMNFMWYLDGGDSIGRLDQVLGTLFERDIRDKILTYGEAKKLLKSFWRNVDEANGWHMMLGGSDHRKKPQDNELTRLCLKTLKKQRRPNSGIRIRKETSDDIWQLIFDSLETGGGNPAFYNEDLYKRYLPDHAGIAEDDWDQFVCGGCTEAMFQGISNIGSIDAGVNILEILEASTKNHVTRVDSYYDFYNLFLDDVNHQIEQMMKEVNLNQQYKALYRPQMIRSLFMDDCIDNGREFNAGGARYNGSVVNIGFR